MTNRLAINSWIFAVVVAWALVAQGQIDPAGLPVYVEHSPVVQDLLVQAQRLEGEQRLVEAVGVYQQIIEQYPHKLVTHNDAVYVDASEQVHRLITENAQLLAAYRQVHEPQAQHLLDGADRLGPDRAAVRQVWARYRLCKAGLEAGLRLAAIYLESAEIDSAANLLDELSTHQDIAAQLSRWHQLQGAAGLFGDDMARYRSHVQALREAGDDPAAQQLEQWSGQVNFPLTPPALDSQQVLPAVSIPDPLGSPLWTVPLSMTSLGTPLAVPPRRKRLSKANPLIAWQSYPVVPVAVGDDLYLSQPQSVVALDRSSGRQRWSYQLAGGVPQDTAGNRRLRQLSRLLAGPRSAVVDGQRLYSVLGYVSNRRPGLQRPGQQSLTSLVCLSRDDGRLLWRLHPHELVPSLTDFDFQGTILAGHGRLFAFVRRSQASGFKDTHLVSLDPRTGRLIWRRHLASVAVITGNHPIPAYMTLQDGGLFIVDGLGVAVRLDPLTGSVRWLTVLKDLPGANHQPARRGARSYPATRGIAFAWAKAGVVVVTINQAPSAVVLDRQSGQQLRKLKGPIWDHASYVMGIHGDVLVVGPTTALLDGQTLQPRWTRQLGPATTAIPNGRPVATENRVLIPAQDQLLVLNLADGATIAEHPLPWPGNILALPEQVVIASTDAVHGYLTWVRAYEHLTDLIDHNPSDPNPGLALAHVALGAKQHQAVLQGVDHAIQSLVRLMPDVAHVSEADQSTRFLHRQVFDHLLQFVTPQRTPDASLRQQLFDRIATATVDASDEVVYRFALGEFHAEVGHPAKAVDQFQAILLDPSLSTEVYRLDTGLRQAGFEARRRLAKLVKQYGSWVYTRYETQAAQRLVELTEALAIDAQALIDLARRMPLAQAAPQARFAAAQAFAGRGQHDQAIQQLRLAYVHTTDVSLIQRVVGRLAQLYEQAHQPRHAAQWLRRAKREYPDLDPIRDAQLVSIDLWIAQLAGRVDPNDHLPSITPPLIQPWTLAARLLTPTGQPRIGWPKDAVVTVSDQTLQYRTGPNLAPRWETPLPDVDVELLALTDEQILLWCPQPGLLLAYDTGTGRPQWPRVHAKSLMEEAGLNQDQQPGLAAQPGLPIRLDVRRFGQGVIPGQPLHRAGFSLMLNDMVVCVVDQIGHVVAIDRYTGQLLWQTTSPWQQTNLVQMNDDVVALAGIAPPRTPRTAASDHGVLVIDAHHGRRRFPAFYSKYPIHWLGFGGDGLLLYATTKQLVAHDLKNGDMTMQVALSSPPIAGFAEPGRYLAMLKQANTGTVLVVNLASGQIVNRISGAPNDPSDLSVYRASGGWHLLTGQQAVALGSEGSILWRDSIIQESGKDLLAQWVGNQYVGLLASALPSDAPQDPRQAMIDQLWRAGVPRQVKLAQAIIRRNDRPLPNPDPLLYRVLLLDRQGGAIGHQYTFGPISEPIDPEHTVFLDNKLLLTTGSRTIVIPGSAKPQ